MHVIIYDAYAFTLATQTSLLTDHTYIILLQSSHVYTLQLYLFLAILLLYTCMTKRPGSQLENFQDTKRLPLQRTFPLFSLELGRISTVTASTISRARTVVYEDGSFYFQVLLRSKEAGTMETVDHFLSVCEMMANVKGEYKFCPGIDPYEYETKYFSKIQYDIKGIRRVNSPFERIDSCNCLLFHKLAKNASIIEKGLECVPLQCMQTTSQ